MYQDTQTHISYLQWAAVLNSEASNPDTGTADAYVLLESASELWLAAMNLEQQILMEAA